MSDISIKKQQIRSEINRRLALLDEDFIRELEEDLPDMLFDIDEFREAVRKAGRIALYRPIKGEIPVDGLAKMLLGEGKTICYPKVEDGVMNFYDVKDLSSASFICGRYGIKEPADTGAVVNGSIDIAVVPGLAYNEEGTRLGRGGGYYDRFFASSGKRPFAVAVCFDFQIDSDIPSEEHDITVDMLLPVETLELEED